MAGNGSDEGEDYMGDLSLFLPESTPSPAAKVPERCKRKKAPELAVTKGKFPRGVSWEQRRRIERERKQREEDERTMAALETAIPETNVGFKLLKRMGYDPLSARYGGGSADPVGIEIRRSRVGIGGVSEIEAAARRERAQEERLKRKEEEMVADFGSRQRMQWRVRRVVWDYRKAEAALAQLEKREVVESPKKEGTEEDKKEEEEEEEVISEEDLMAMLMKLRDEHCYCLYCGCQYESLETMASECPGPHEDDH